MGRLFEKYDKYIITSPFGYRVLWGQKKYHNGIDLVATVDGKTGLFDYIKAHTGGTVEEVGYDATRGNYVSIRVTDRATMWYYHMMNKSVKVSVGDKVTTGQVIGYMGKTGKVTGAHLHFGIMENGEWINPEPFLERDYCKEPVVIYRVQTGAFKLKLNADRYMKSIKNKGFDAFITKIDGWYKVQVGAYEVKANAERMLNNLKNAGFNGFITTATK